MKREGEREGERAKVSDMKRKAFNNDPSIDCQDANTKIKLKHSHL